jgi:shikimate dehydrogenase
MLIDGNTRLIAHVGHPTGVFKSPLIYNPYFDSIGLNAAVVPMGVRRENGLASLDAIMRMSNVIGALVTMPLKVDVVAMLDEPSAAVRIAGSCNALKRGPDGRLVGDNFDGEGFVRGLERKGVAIKGASALVVGAGGVGAAIAAALAGRGVARLVLTEPDQARGEALAARLRHHHPALDVVMGTPDPAGCGIVVNATPLGMEPRDPLPLDPASIAPEAIVGDVVMAQEMTPFLRAAAARGCRVQIGLDMLFEQIPAYLSFFGLPTTTPDVLRAVMASPRAPDQEPGT